MEQLNDISPHIRVGVLGEDIAARYLETRGFVLIERNYRKKWGEIDLILLKEGKVYFIEVKSVSYETKDDLRHSLEYRQFRPEENVHNRKLARIGRAIQTWRAEWKDDRPFQIDIVTVRMVPREKYAVVDVIEEITW